MVPVAQKACLPCQLSEMAEVGLHLRLAGHAAGPISTPCTICTLLPDSGAPLFPLPRCSVHHNSNSQVGTLHALHLYIAKKLQLWALKAIKPVWRVIMLQRQGVGCRTQCQRWASSGSCMLAPASAYCCTRMETWLSAQRPWTSDYRATDAVSN